MTDPLPSAVEVRSVTPGFVYRVHLDSRIVGGSAPTAAAARAAALEVFDVHLGACQHASRDTHSKGGGDGDTGGDARADADDRDHVVTDGGRTITHGADTGVDTDPGADRTPAACPNCGHTGAFDGQGLFRRHFWRVRHGQTTHLDQWWAQHECGRCGHVFRTLEAELPADRVPATAGWGP